MKQYHTIIIGGSQAGLAAAYYLKKQGRYFVILEAANDIGDGWSGRYDSLRLFTSAKYNSLPGMSFPGDQNRFPTKDDVADYLKSYAAHFQFPIMTGQRVTSLSKSGDHFTVETINQTFTAQNVIVCTGPFQTPFIPEFGKDIADTVYQVHSSEYKNPGQLKDGLTLVVGGGNSGVQIVEEIANAGKVVFFSFGGKLKRMPNNRLTQRLIFGSGITSASIHSMIGRWLKNRPEPVMGTDLKDLFSKPNVLLVGRTMTACGNKINCEKVLLNSVDNVIWATGFKPNFDWIKEGIFNKNGFPIQDRGVTKIKGLYFLGLAWMHSRNSGLLGGVKEDAEYITDQII